MKRFIFALFSAAMLASVPAAAQTAGQMPTPAQALAAMNDPAIRERLLAQVRSSGLSPDQIRSRLRSMGYGDEIINQLLGAAADTTAGSTEDVFAAARALGVVDSATANSISAGFAARKQARAQADSALLDSLGVALKDDSVRAAVRRVLTSRDARRAGIENGLSLFGREIFERETKQFDPAVNGPLPTNYRVGFGDQFALLLTGDVERSEQLSVSRDGSVVLRDVGQVAAANLTFDQLRAQLADRLGRVYSGIRTGQTRFSLLPVRVGMNQVFVLGEVVTPNAYQISRLGTVLTALYAAGGPSENGDARTIEVKRNNAIIASMDLYDYLLAGSSSSDLLLENGDVVFVRPQGRRVRVRGAVVRPATYELKAGEKLDDVIRMAGGFRAEADRRRVQIERVVPPARRTAPGRDKEVLDVPVEALTPGSSMESPSLEADDIVTVPRINGHIPNTVKVSGNVWSEMSFALTPDMTLSDALSRAGGVKPDTYLGTVQISRLQPDSTRQMVRVALGSDFRPVEDLVLAPDDQIRVYSLTDFRTPRFVTIGGSVRAPVNVPYQEGLTLRDAVLAAGGLLESAMLTEVEIASLPKGDRSNRVTAVTRRIQLDSSYLLETATGRRNPTSVTNEIFLQPYDAVTILRQPGFTYQRTVRITGEVKFGGLYALKSKDDRLLDLIQRAGGLTPDAYPAGIHFTRGDTVGRVGVDLPGVLRNPKHRDNILLEAGDVIHIPTYTPLVTVRGEVNSVGIAVTYVDGADIDYYIGAAGGRSKTGDDRRAYVIQPSGKVQTKRHTAYVFQSTPEPQAGSTVVVPVKDPDLKARDWIAIAQTTLGLMTSMVTVAVLIRSR
jgi:polysaccharide biosynthesis/export protein